MNEFLNFSNIFFLVLAVVIFLRLRSVLGRRTGQERPPFDPYSGGKGKEQSANGAPADNVVTLPRQPVERDNELAEDERRRKLEKIAPQGSALNEALRRLMSVDGSFDPNQFLGGARKAYEMIVSAFAEGDRGMLKQLLSAEVYEGFVGAIADRESRGETIESTFVGIDKAEIVEAGARGSSAQVTVRFKSQLITVTRDSENRVIEGDPNRVVEVTDVWTFARDMQSRDPNWKLVATEAAD